VDVRFLDGILIFGSFAFDTTGKEMRALKRIAKRDKKRKH
jgi:hypothetical protein